MKTLVISFLLVLPNLVFSQSACDINGDKINDLIFAMPNVDNGQVWVWYGTKDLVEFPAQPNQKINSLESTTGFAKAVTCVGDIDGDGFGDILASASSTTGEVYILEGTANGAHFDAQKVIKGTQAEQGFGEHLSALGDLNKDGKADFAVTSAHLNMETVSVFFGNLGNDYSKSSWSFKGNDFIYWYGQTPKVTAQIDFNGDKVLDFLLEFSDGSPFYGGTLYYIFSGADFSTLKHWIYSNGCDCGLCGRQSYGILPDTNLDGKSDILFSSYEYYAYHLSILTPSEQVIARFYDPQDKPVIDRPFRNPTFLFADDFNQNGQTDFYFKLANEINMPVDSVFEASINGLKKQAISQVQLGAQNIPIGDINGDHYPDLLSVFKTTSHKIDFVVYKGSANGLGASILVDTQAEIPQESILKVYPNPFVNDLFAQTKVGETITLYNSMGQEVLQKTVENQVEQLSNLSKLPNGVYFLKLGTNAQQVFKLVKVD